MKVASAFPRSSYLSVRLAKLPFDPSSSSSSSSDPCAHRWRERTANIDTRRKMRRRKRLPRIAVRNSVCIVGGPRWFYSSKPVPDKNLNTEDWSDRCAGMDLKGPPPCCGKARQSHRTSQESLRVFLLYLLFSLAFRDAPILHIRVPNTNNLSSRTGSEPQAVAPANPCRSIGGSSEARSAWPT